MNGTVQKKSTGKRILLRIFAVLVGAVLIFQAAFFIYYLDFYRLASPQFSIPGLNENFVPQGLEACGDGFYLMSGYISTTGCSRIYYISRQGKARSIRVCWDDGRTLVSHSGGICTNGPFTYLAGGGGKVYILSSADLFDGASREANILGRIETANAASFCCIQGDHLLIGEYEYGKRFTTPDSHHLKTPAGDQNTAMILSYPLDGDQPFGIQQSPDAIYSIPSRVQGMCFTGDGRVVLSASSFKDSSQLYLYDLDMARTGKIGIHWLNGTPLPVYYLDSACEVDTIPLPPYSEETIFENNRLFILFESASSRFRFGRLVGGQYVYSMELPEWSSDNKKSGLNF